ncbi:hypothetical protein PG996_013896 [Apiospora saccharicola]|uniref:Uncharacterized protein n=1 Tax=Apiospora saccharicola TaxID=335842 RepID=A0ABR1THF6_9PEZI
MYSKSQGTLQNPREKPSSVVRWVPWRTFRAGSAEMVPGSKAGRLWMEKAHRRQAPDRNPAINPAHVWANVSHSRHP